MEATWVCEHCTYTNSVEVRDCEVCSLPRTLAPKLTYAEKVKELETPKEWICSNCTLVNISTRSICEACEFAKPSAPKNTQENKKIKLENVKVCPYSQCGAVLNSETYEEHVSLHQLEAHNADEEFQKLRRRYGFDPNPERGTNYIEQYEKSLDFALKKKKITEEEYEKKKKQIRENLLGAETYKTWGNFNLNIRDVYSEGMIGMLKSFFGRSKGFQQVILSDPVDHYCSDRGDSGWGCGYRNIQMLCSYLITHPAYKLVLFGGVGHVPTIPVIQEWIDTAWSIGFDTEGARQLGESIFDTKRMIGATECATLLRSFGIKAKIMDFVSSKNPNYIKPVEGKKKDKQNQEFKPNKEMVQWVYDYFVGRSKLGEVFMPPLYLQHDGHSRTIVGVEKRGNQINLIIFDPSHWGSTLRTDLQDGKIKKLKKDLQHFNRGKYQIVYVESGLMTPTEMESCKHMDSVRVESK